MLPQYHFLAFFLVILGLFFPQVISRPVISQTACPQSLQLSTGGTPPWSSCQKSKNILHSLLCQDRPPDPALPALHPLLWILTSSFSPYSLQGHSALCVCVISFFLSPPSPSLLSPSSPPQADFCAQRFCTLPGSRLFTANSSLPTLNLRVPCPSPCPGVPRLFLPGHDPLLTDQEAPLQGISSKQSNWKSCGFIGCLLLSCFT